MKVTHPLLLLVLVVCTMPKGVAQDIRPSVLAVNPTWMIEPIFGGIIPGNVDDFEIDWIDTDADGMPDDWETANGLNPADPGDADTDLDEDGLTNLREYWFDSDPANPDSDEGGASDFSEWVLTTVAERVLDAGAFFASTLGGGSYLSMILDAPSLMWLRDPITANDEENDDEENDDDEDLSDDFFRELGGNKPIKPDVTAPGFRRNSGAGATSSMRGMPDESGSFTDLRPFEDETNALGIIASLTPSFDPNDDSDDEAAISIEARLRGLGLWQTMVDIANGDIDLIEWIMSMQRDNIAWMNNPGRPNQRSNANVGSGNPEKSVPDMAGARNSSGNSAINNGGFGGGFGGGTPTSGAQGNGGVTAKSSSGGGMMGGGNNESGSAHGIISAKTRRPASTTTTYSSSMVVSSNSRSSHGAPDGNSQRQHFSDSFSSSAAPAKKSISAINATPTDPEKPGKAPAVALMGFLSAMAWAGRRLIF